MNFCLSWIDWNRWWWWWRFEDCRFEGWWEDWDLRFLEVVLIINLNLRIRSISCAVFKLINLGWGFWNPRRGWWSFLNLKSVGLFLKVDEVDGDEWRWMSCFDEWIRLLKVSVEIGLEDGLKSKKGWFDLYSSSTKRVSWRCWSWERFEEDWIGLDKGWFEKGLKRSLSWNRLAEVGLNWMSWALWIENVLDSSSRSWRCWWWWWWWVMNLIDGWEFDERDLLFWLKSWSSREYKS